MKKYGSAILAAVMTCAYLLSPVSAADAFPEEAAEEIFREETMFPGEEFFGEEISAEEDFLTAEEILTDEEGPAAGDFSGEEEFLPEEELFFGEGEEIPPADEALFPDEALFAEEEGAAPGDEAAFPGEALSEEEAFPEAAADESAGEDTGEESAEVSSGEEGDLILPEEAPGEEVFSREDSGLAGSGVITERSFWLESYEYYVVVGGTCTVGYSYEPEDADVSKLQWEINDANIAAVENGVITGKETGETYATVRFDGSYLTTFRINVVESMRVTEVRVTPYSLRLIPGNRFMADTYVAPSYALNKDLVWSSSDESVVSVDDGLITAVAPGTANVYADSAEVAGVRGTCRVTVESSGPITGTCGDNVAWEIMETASGSGRYKLKISGTGPVDCGLNGMADAFREDLLPWAVYRSALVSVEIEEGITALSDYLFYDFGQITEVSVPETLTSIGERTFEYCRRLAWINLPGVMTKIGKSAFACCRSLEAVRIPNGLTEIKGGAFRECGLRSLTLPEGIRKLGSASFEDCQNLAEIDLPNSLTEIEMFAFSRCRSLRRVDLPDGLTAIAGDTFSGCKSLREIDIPDAVGTIGEYAFGGCSALEHVRLPAQLNEIGTNAFAACTSLGSIEFPESGVSVLARAFSGCTALRTAVFRDGAQRVSADVFIRCPLEGVYVYGRETVFSKDSFIECPDVIMYCYSDSKAKAYAQNVGHCPYVRLDPRVPSITGIRTVKGGIELTLHTPDTVIQNEDTVDSDLYWNLTPEGSFRYLLYRKEGDGGYQLIANLGRTGDLTYTDDTIDSSGGCYTYKLIAFNKCKGIEYRSEAGTERTQYFVPTTSISSLENVSGGVKISWKKVPFADGYKIIRNGVTFRSVDGSGTVSTVDTGAASGSGELTYIVRAFRKKGDSAVLSLDSAAKTWYFVPRAVLTSADPVTGGIMVAWESVSEAGGYILYRNGEEVKRFSGSSVLSYKDSLATVTGQKYVYTMKVYRSVSGHDYGGAESREKAAYYIARPEISSLAVTAKGVQVKWKKITGATGYQVFRNGKSVKTLSGEGTVSYEDPGAKTSGTKYTFSVCAVVNADGKTYKGQNAPNKVIYYLSKPSLTPLANVSNGVKLTWGKIAGASGYYLYRGSTRIRDIKSGDTLTYVDKDSAQNSKEYRYKLYAYKTEGGTTYRSLVSGERKTIYLSRPAISSAANDRDLSVLVKWPANSAADGYQVEYAKGSEVKTVTVSGSAQNLKRLSQLTKNAVYAIRVRSFRNADGTRYYSAWSAAKNVKVTR